MSPKNRSLNRSQEYLQRARKVIPSCTQTFSKGWTQFVQGVAPIYLERGQGSHAWDVDGNSYIDYIMGLGPLILGYNDPDVTAAVQRQLSDGVIFSLPHPLEVEVAELLAQVVPCAEMVRFGKNGSDATTGAIRAARAYTGRDLVASCGYHGWQDWSIGTTTRNLGVPEGVRRLTLPFTYNNIDSLKALFSMHPGQIAAVIMEPIGVETPTNDFLREVADLTRRDGALLIFDEVLTGFRIALGGAQEFFGVSPDLACFAKAMANGFPLSAVVGRRQVMEVFDQIFFSFTFGGEAVALAACRATVEKLRMQPVLEHVWRQGRRLQDGVNAAASSLGLESHVQCVGLPPRTVVVFKDGSGQDSLTLRSLFQQELIKRDILFSVGFNPSWAHADEDVERTLEACSEALRIVSRGLENPRIIERLLEGPPVQPVFRRP